MKLRIIFAWLVLLAAPLAFSKGPADLILISGGGLAQPIEIRDPSVLKAFDPWMGQFADWQQKPQAEAPCFRRSFEVQFYLKWPGRESSSDHGDLQLIYTTRYCFTGQTGYVYLPGRGEPQYGANGGTIIRGAADGKWHVATAAWDSLMNEAVATIDQQRTADMILVSGGELKHPLEITDPELLTQFNPWAGAFVDWDHVSGGRLSWEYEILFFKRSTDASTPTSYDRDGLTLIYGIRYCIDEDGGPGSVHLAGGNDKFGPENVRMVWDGTQAGQWHPATPAWHDLIEHIVARQKSAR